MQPLRLLAWNLVVALTYAVMGALGLLAASYGHQVTLLWAPTGLALGALVVGGRGLAPGVWLGALAVNLWVGTPWWVCALIATGNTLEGVVGAALLRRWKVDVGLGRLTDVYAFLGLGVLAAPLVGATFGVLALWVGGQAPIDQLPRVWSLWWLGDALGALLFGPVVLTVADGWQRAWSRPVPWVTTLALTAVLAVLAFVWWGAPERYLVAALVFPVMFVAAHRYGSALAAAVVCVVGAAAVAGAASDGAGDAPATWGYLAVLGGSMLVTIAIVAERDASQRQAQLIAERALEAQRLESLGLVAGGVAHDFNNLLQVILGYTMMLAEDGGDPHSVRQVEAAVGQASRLCDQLLAYAGQAPLEVETLWLGEELRELTALLRVAVPPGVSLVELPGPRVVVSCDRGRLHQAVMNLVTNAGEACAEHGGTVTVRWGEAELSAEQLARAAVVSGEASPGSFGWVDVSDDGAGMGEATLARLFEPFFSTKFAGRGLGMASLAGVVRAQGGAVFVSSVVGEGTVVRVAFPATTAEPRSHPPEPAIMASVGGTLLVADDDDEVRELSVRMLREAGWDVVEARHGLEALDRVDEMPWLVGVVLDYAMPGMDGARVLAHIRRARPGLPVLLCSGYDERHAIDAFGPPDAYLQKPFTPAELRQAVGRMCGATARGDGPQETAH